MVNEDRTALLAATASPDDASPWSMSRKLAHWLVPAAIVFVGSMFLDTRTLMPGLGFWDTGEFQALGPVLGIAHPTGYPSYVLLLWLASVLLQPFGDPALRANLLSAILISGASALVTVAVIQVTRRAAIGVVAGALLAVAPIAWQNAVRADPHGLHLFLSALLLVLLLGWGIRERAGRPHAGRWLLAAAVCFGVSLGNHALTLLLAPGIALFVLAVSPRLLWQQWKLVLGCAAALALTAIVLYAYIPIRASMHPPLDYAHPTDWASFSYLVFGQQFTGTFHAMPSLSTAIRTVWDVLETNLGVGALVAVVGLVVGIWRRPRLMLLTVPWFVLPVWFLLGYENADIDRYYLVPIMVAVVWAALALDWAWDVVLLGWRWLRPGGAPVPRLASTFVTVGAASLLLVTVLSAVPTRYDSVDASMDTDARQFLDATLGALAPDPVIISWWSYSTPLWYGRWVEGDRPDMTIIDDRTMLDEHLGSPGCDDLGGSQCMLDVIDGYLDERPVYLIRLEGDLPDFRERFVLEQVPGILHGTVWRVVGRRPAAGGRATGG
jgi:hypothetical protein